ncbi:methyltransferase, FkbM family [Dyadobacter sp. SG02]|uniref:FkbM family methyltransferase n=1 Tax=Dyadobacter sp. SG02 TaxID=1855291 RepID=UPI0008B4DB21|nr:FkbM family methyltransferase [Dyadobacter sp. SG02]SEI65262.1 methyltransferase, FkbM family [Dyadobacter sp. SG02]
MASLTNILKKSVKDLTRYVNFTKSITQNNKRFKIPVVNNIGLPNFAVEDKNWFLQLLKAVELPQGSSFIDIGVNVGQSLIAFRSYGDNPYYGFEPSPECVFYVNKLIKANKLRNTHLIPIGLSSSTEILKFYCKEGGDQSATIVGELRPGHYSEEDVSYIPVFPFDELDMKGIGDISFIKIDVEGAELEVLTGLRQTLQKHNPVITCEVLDCHNAETNLKVLQDRANRLVELVKSLNYTIYRIRQENGLNFEKIEEIILKQYDSQSHYLNDYLFLPSTRKIEALLTR